MTLLEGVVVRGAEERDLADVIALNRAALPENYVQEFFENLLRNYGELFLVAEAGGRVFGYAMCRVEMGFSSKGFGIVRKGHVVSIAVDAGHRRAGIGTALMEEVMRRMRQSGLKECFLEVRVTNEPAVRLYEKLGFKIARRLPYYYSDGVDGYLMSHSLQG